MEAKELSYDDLIFMLDDSSFSRLDFSVKGYGHYKNCSIVCEIVPVSEIIKHGKIITFTLAKDEVVTFYGNFNKEEKLFKIRARATLP
jgi:hypothetical protein